MISLELFRNRHNEMFCGKFPALLKLLLFHLQGGRDQGFSYGSKEPRIRYYD